MNTAEPTNSRTVLVTGGTGFIGRHLCPILQSRGWKVIVWRHRDELPDETVDAVVNLAGARILGPPWTKHRRRVLMESRVGTTTKLVQWMAQRARRPAVLVSASAVGFYGVHADERLDESAGPQPVFQSEICRAWEEAADHCTALGVRCVLPRFGVVLGSDGGALPAFVRPARLGIAAVMGSGRQGFPWLHIDDAVGIILWALENQIEGPLNAVAPGLVSQREFQQVLCDVLRRPLWLRVPVWPVRLALGEMSQLLVDGQYVQPSRAVQAGFLFRHPELRDALDDLLKP